MAFFTAWEDAVCGATRHERRALGDVMIMDEILWTTAYLLGVLGPWGPVKTGQLSLSKGVLTLERRGTRDPLFSVPVDEVRARFPRLYFGLGLQLITRGKRY